LRSGLGHTTYPSQPINIIQNNNLKRNATPNRSQQQLCILFQLSLPREKKPAPITTSKY